MKVIHINTKSKSPKNDLNNINRLLITKSKNSSKNAKASKTRNLDFSSNNAKKKDIFKRIFPHNNYIHFSSNNCTSTNTTNFNNTKTNNFIFFENDFNFKDAEKLKQQINSLIKHNSSNNFSNFKTSCSNIKLINNNFGKEKDRKKKKDFLSNNIKIHSKEDNNTDLYGNTKNDKLYINTNYSILLNNTKKEKEKNKKICTKIQNFKNCINFYNSRPLTLNFSNELNNFNSYKLLLKNKSMKYLSKCKPNYRKNIVLNDNTTNLKKKGNSENKEYKKKDLLIDNKKIKGSKSYNILFTHKRDNLSKSTSFSPIHEIKQNKKDNKKKHTSNLKKIKNNKSLIGIRNNSIERVQINLYNKKNNSTTNNKVTGRKNISVKSSNDKINIQFFSKIDNKIGKMKKNSIKTRGVINSQKTSPFSSKKLNNKNKVIVKNKNHYDINVDYEIINEKRINKTFIKANKKVTNNDNTSIITPEQNHFLAIKQIQQIKNNNNVFK